MTFAKALLALWVSLGFFATGFTQQSQPQANPRQQTGVATGFLVAPNMLVTAHHAVVDREKIFVGTGEGNKLIRAELLAADQNLDIALIRAEVLGAPLVFAQWGTVPIGIETHAIGFPSPRSAGLEPKITSGVLNGIHRQKGNSHWFQFSAEIQKGNSGGPVLAPDGSVIGVTTHKLDAIKIAERTKDLPQNVNFAVNSGVVVGFLRSHGVDPQVRPMDRLVNLRTFQVYSEKAGSVFPIVSTRPAPDHP